MTSMVLMQRVVEASSVIVKGLALLSTGESRGVASSTSLVADRQPYPRPFVSDQPIQSPISTDSGKPPSVAVLTLVHVPHGE